MRISERVLAKAATQTVDLGNLDLIADYQGPGRGVYLTLLDG